MDRADDIQGPGPAAIDLLRGEDNHGLYGLIFA
jgi:hypothetical protein